jgi:RNA polymerase sigma-70 factor (ECF subfamily)
MDTVEISTIKACQAGDMEKFGQLYDKYIKKIYDFVYFKTNHQETCEDIVSLVFLKAVEKIKDFKLGKGTFQAWLYQIARNTVIDHYRTKKDASNIDDYWSISDKTDILRDTEIKLKLEEVDEYLQQLKPMQREIIIMRVWQGMSYKEISEITGKSEASAKMVFSRAINKLREEVPLPVFLFLLIYGF